MNILVFELETFVIKICAYVFDLYLNNCKTNI